MDDSHAIHRLHLSACRMRLTIRRACLSSGLMARSAVARLLRQWAIISIFGVASNGFPQASQNRVALSIPQHSILVASNASDSRVARRVVHPPQLSRNPLRVAPFEFFDRRLRQSQHPAARAPFSATDAELERRGRVRCLPLSQSGEPAAQTDSPKNGEVRRLAKGSHRWQIERRDCIAARVQSPISRRSRTALHLQREPGIGD